MKQAATIYGHPVEIDSRGEPYIKIGPTTYGVVHDLSRDDFTVHALTFVPFASGGRRMALTHDVSRHDVERLLPLADQPLPNAAHVALAIGVEKLKPQVEYRLKELNDEDTLSPDPAINEILKKALAEKAAEKEREDRRRKEEEARKQRDQAHMESLELWGAWG